MSLPEIKLTINRPDGPTETRSHPPGVYVIGRHPDSDIFIETPLISRSHARLTIKETESIIEDLDSSNGTYVDGVKISAAKVLRPLETVRLGPVTVEIRHPAPSSAAPALSLGSKRDALRALLPPEFLRERKYEVGNVIAEGGMGAVMSARELTIQREVAMKVMLPSESADDVLRFVSEAKVTGQLEHPNIVPVHELGVDEKEQVFYTMKLVRGINLRQVLDLLHDGKADAVLKYPLAQLLTVFQKVCDAVAFAHAKGVIHRDLKPENVMLGDYGEVMVMDWGLAKVLDPTRAGAANVAGHSIIRTGVRAELHDVEVQSGKVMGTPQYMAPEQAYAQHEALDARTDVYALGAILHHILTLRPPIEGDDPQEVLKRAAFGKWEPARHSTAGAKRLPHLPGGKVPDALSTVAEKAMANHADDRYQKVIDLQADIESYQIGLGDGPGIAAPHPAPAITPPPPPRRGFALAFVLAFLLFAAAVAYIVQQRLANDAATAESLILVQKVRAAHPDGTGLTKADYEALAVLAEKQRRPEFQLYRDLAAGVK